MKLPKLSVTRAAVLLSASGLLAEEPISSIATLSPSEAGFALGEVESSFITPVMAQCSDSVIEEPIQKTEAEIETPRNRLVTVPADPFWQFDRCLESQDDGSGGRFGSAEVYGWHENELKILS